VRLVVDILVPDDEAARRRALHSAGIVDGRLQPGLAPTVGFGQAARLLGNLAEGRPEGWHLSLASRLDAAVHGPLGFALLSSATLADALETLVAYAEVRFPFVWFTQSVDRRLCRVECLPRGDLGALRRPLMELSVVGVARLVAQISGQSGNALRARFPGPPPAYAARLQEAGGAGASFGADSFGIEFPVGWLAQPGLYADEGMNRLSLAKCRELRADGGPRSGLAIGIRQELLSRRGRSPGLEALARSRHMSSRTLIRRLKQQGTSYREIAAEVHAGLAADLLRHTGLSVAEIADRLGFADPANFGRAFRGWFGTSPGRYRASRE